MKSDPKAITTNSNATLNPEMAPGLDLENAVTIAATRPATLAGPVLVTRAAVIQQKRAYLRATISARQRRLACLAATEDYNKVASNNGLASEVMPFAPGEQTIRQCTTPLLAIPHELLLMISDFLKPKDIYSLLQTHRKFAAILPPSLSKYALTKGYSVPAFYWAAANRDQERIGHMLEKAVGIAVVEYRGADNELVHKSPLDSGRRDAVTKYVLEKGPDVQLKFRPENDPRTGVALCWAVQESHEAMVRHVLERGANIQGRLDGWTALHIAVHHSNVPLAKLLLDKGINVNGEGNGFMPLHQALGYYQNEAMARLLLSRGAWVDAKTGWHHETPLHLAIRRSNIQEEDLERLLREFNQSFRGSKPTGRELVAKSQSERMIVLFLNLRGMKVNKEDLGGRCAWVWEELCDEEA